MRTAGIPQFFLRVSFSGIIRRKLRAPFLAKQRTFRLFFASPFPDEFYASYFGRLVDLNGLPKDRIKALKILKALVSKECSSDGREPQTMEVLAFSAAMNLPDFIRNHTLLPYRRAIASHKETLRHGDPSDLKLVCFAAPRVARAGAYFCVECIGEDDQFLGMSYWRRSHQIPGMLMCPVHGVALRYVDTEDGFRVAPSQCLPVSRSISEEWAQQSHANPLVRKFIQLSLELAGSDKPLQVKPVRFTLAQRARQQGLATHINARKNLLSDRIVECFPQEWLESVFPGITSKQRGKTLAQIDGVLFLNTCSSTVAAYLLVICILFDSTEQALDALQAANSVDRVPRTRNCTPRGELDFESLQADYVESMGSHAAVAKKHTMPVITISQQLRNLGLPNLTLAGNRSGSLLEAASNFFIAGLSLTDSAMRANVRQIDLERIVRYAGADLTASLKQMFPKAVDARANARLGVGQLPHQINLTLCQDEESDRLV